MLPTQAFPLQVEVSGPVVFTGDETTLTVGLLTGLRAVRPGQPLMIVDGANAFDPFLVATLARKAGVDPKAVLDEIRISRVFTCHQLEALIVGRLQSSLARFGAKAVLFTGLLDPLLDEEVALKEARRIFKLIPPLLERLTGGGVLALCVCPPLPIPAGREGFLPSLNRLAAWAFTVTRAAGDAIQIACVKPRKATWIWEPEMGMLVPRRWW